MKWIRYRENDMLRELGSDEMAALKSGAPTLLLTSDGEYHVHREGQLAPRGVEHFALIEPPRKPWWEELPEEAVWFELDISDPCNRHLAHECFARYPGTSDWYWIASGGVGRTLEEWAPEYKEARLIQWR